MNDIIDVHRSASPVNLLLCPVLQGTYTLNALFSLNTNERPIVKLPLREVWNHRCGKVSQWYCLLLDEDQGGTQEEGGSKGSRIDVIKPSSDY